MRSWLIITTTILFLPDRTFRSLITSIWCLMSRFAVGSSSRRISGSWARPLASMTLWCCPAESSLNGRMAMSEMSIISITSFTTARSWRRDFHLLCGFLTIRIVSTTVMGKVSDEAQGTYPTFLARSLAPYSLTSTSSTMTTPLVGSRILLMQCMSVDFPTPFGPTMETSCGCRMSRLMPFRMSSPLA